MRVVCKSKVTSVCRSIGYVSIATVIVDAFFRQHLSKYVILGY